MTARKAIQNAGGLASAADLSRKWGVSKARITVLTAKPSFPRPVADVGGRPVWLVKEAQQWRDTQLNGGNS